MTDLTPLLARCDFPPPGSKVDCAVSGGPDSLALLALARAAECEVTAIYVDHGLRENSPVDGKVVEEAAVRFGARFKLETVTVFPGPNLEARARSARYEVLPKDVLTGHTADDQAETVILNFIRGAGVDGLAGIRRSRKRPILALRRQETRQLCADLGFKPVIDESNDDPMFRRNRVRHELLPLLNDIAQRDVVKIISRQADLIRDDADLLDELSAVIDPTDGRALASAPVALARRAIRRWIVTSGYADAELHPPDAASVDRVLAVARNEVTACELVGGLRVRRSAGRLFLTPPTLTPPPGDARGPKD